MRQVLGRAVNPGRVLISLFIVVCLAGSAWLLATGHFYHGAAAIVVAVLFALLCYYNSTSHRSRHEPSTQLHENARFTVYRPDRIRVNHWYPLLVFAHRTPSDTDSDSFSSAVSEVQRQAENILGLSAKHYSPLSSDAGAPVPQDGELRIVPEIEGVDCNPTHRCFAWKEDTHKEEFRIRVSDEHRGSVLRGRVSIYFRGIVIADIAVSIAVASTETEAIIPSFVSESAQRYRRVFVSYSHKDSEIVKTVVAVGRALGDEFVRDRTHLKSGEKWAERLRAFIREADVFQLFWSTNAMDSPQVEEEWRYALQLDRHAFVRPVYWEEPLPTCPERKLPPPELLRLNFQQLPIAKMQSHSYEFGGGVLLVLLMIGALPGRASYATLLVGGLFLVGLVLASFIPFDRDEPE